MAVAAVVAAAMPDSVAVAAFVVVAFAVPTRAPVACPVAVAVVVAAAVPARAPVAASTPVLCSPARLCHAVSRWLTPSRQQYLEGPAVSLSR